MSGRAIAVGLTGANQTIETAGHGPGTYLGIAARETSGAGSATVLVYDGTSATGVLLDTFHLPANGSASQWYGPQGIAYDRAIHVAVTGAVDGSVRHA
jgi:hypothetical protein